MDSYSTIN